MTLDLKRHYSRFLGARPDVLHFAAHSHHPWPDVTRDAVTAAWDDAARLADHKWDHVLGTVVPRAQAHVARTLGLSRPGQIAFAPTVHELFYRVLSCFPAGRPVRILSTDGEFYSFTRQAARLEESGEAVVTRVPVEPFATFDARFLEAAAQGGHDLVYLSHVFFNSGFAVADLSAVVRATEALVMVDGYHAFMALPVDLGPVQDRAFYTAGGYKYAQAGEGACFLHVPADTALRPRHTGWFARFGRLTAAQAGGVEYPDDAYRFWGATFDPTGIYRLNAVMDWLQAIGVGVADVHAHVRTLQRRFLDRLPALGLRALPADALVTPPDLARQGHFLTFRVAEAAAFTAALRARGVDVDSRADRVRFGFGIYQTPDDVDRLAERLRGL
jgi:selenocysteine lyase/cysteine desulfurase